MKSSGPGKRIGFWVQRDEWLKSNSTTRKSEKRSDIVRNPTARKPVGPFSNRPMELLNSSIHRPRDTKKLGWEAVHCEARQRGRQFLPGREPLLWSHYNVCSSLSLEIRFLLDLVKDWRRSANFSLMCFLVIRQKFDTSDPQLHYLNLSNYYRSITNKCVLC